MSAPGGLSALLAERRIVVCCGSGGVGKTTTAAALALAGALEGRRACVVTVDPARRLADALGVAAIGNVPHKISGAFPGELSAVMLDAKGTFDDLIRRYAADEAQAARILDNRLYRNLVTALSGTQEYMATEKLYELHEEDAFDLIVVDTPPTRNALDFLDAPRRLTGFLDNRIFRLLVSPGRAYMRAMSVAAQLLLRTLARVAGSEIVDDTVAFFQAFEGMEAGFRERAARVEQLLAEAATGFVLVAAPRRESVAEAEFLARRLDDLGHRIDALIVNRVLVGFDRPSPLGAAGTATAPATHVSVPAPAAVGGHAAYDALRANLEELSALGVAEERLVGTLASGLASRLVRVPELGTDVHDLAVLEALARYLLHGEETGAAGGDAERGAAH